MATRYRFSVEEFERLFAEVKGVELLEGEIYEMSPIGPKHAAAVGRMTGTLASRFAGRAVIWVQNPLRIPPSSELQPDLMLLLPPDGRYESRLAEPADVLLVVEVGDSTLSYDREHKLPLYAEAGIPEYWILNLVDDVLEVYREPIGRNYRSRTLYRSGEPVEFMGERLGWW
ncbi:Uma2 family endonuclease [Calidithermus chliarophilus]|uniref:Uma2 family endonuclease n=1 Tax=Calidithermus chliarophilus TaxID=52023 RepID=UPI0003F97E16|nr:Uma2 family endonuclease [Calidithermus chliarophilus]